MGQNVSCKEVPTACKYSADCGDAQELDLLEAMPVTEDPFVFTNLSDVCQAPKLVDSPFGAVQAHRLAQETAVAGSPSFGDEFSITLDKTEDTRLGITVNMLAKSGTLQITAITGGIVGQWNSENPDLAVLAGDHIVEVNGARDDPELMMTMCSQDTFLWISLKRIGDVVLTYDQLVKDLEDVIRRKSCGAAVVNLSWHDPCMYSKGLSTPAPTLLAGVAKKYCPNFISNADLWALAANVAIKVMGGPDIPTRFGRVDAKSSVESVSSQAGRLPDAEQGPAHLREIFYPTGFDDQAIVALSGVHTVGRCRPERCGCDGPWTEDPLTFSNSYFRELLAKTYTAETSSYGCTQHRHAKTGTTMLSSDLALVKDPDFKRHVERYASDQDAFFKDFAQAWITLQESGCRDLRDRP